MRRFLLSLLFAIALGPPLFSQSKAGPFTINASTSPCATIAVPQQSTVGISVTGTFSATLQPKVAMTGRDGSTAGAPQNTQVTPTTSSTAQSTITTAGMYKSAVGGFDTFLVCVSSYASGTATIYLNTTTAVNAGLLGGGGGGGVTSFNARTGAVVPVATDYTSLTALATANNGTGDMNVGTTSTGTVALGGTAGVTAQVSDGHGEITLGPYTGGGDTGGIFMVGDLGSVVEIDIPQQGAGNTHGGVYFGISNGGDALFELNSIAGTHSGDIPFLFQAATSGLINLNQWMDQSPDVRGLGLPPLVYTDTVDTLTANYKSGAATQVASCTTARSAHTCLIRISGVESISRAAGSSSTLPSLTLGWTDGGSVARTQTLVATSTTNTTAVLTAFSVAIAVLTNTNVTVTSASYASSGSPTMAYELGIAAEILE